MEKCLDLGLCGLYPSLLEIGLAAAAAVEGFVHVFAQLPQVTFPGHQTEGIAFPVFAGKYRRRAGSGGGNRAGITFPL